jgi:hypothetical protein
MKIGIEDHRAAADNGTAANFDFVCAADDGGAHAHLIVNDQFRTSGHRGKPAESTLCNGIGHAAVAEGDIIAEPDA